MAAAADADFIDIDVTSCSTTSREFEFQMSVENDSTTSPADELFFKGKLLPLHLPPRLLMLQTLLNITTQEEIYEDCGNIPFLSSSTSTNACCTPAESSPSESCRVSCELNPSEFFFQWSTDQFGSFVHNHPKKTWSKKLKLMKQKSCLLSQKLKNSRVYLKALFIKSVSSNESSNSSKAAGENREAVLNRITKKNTFEMRCNDDNIVRPRRSFSGAIKRHSPSKCLSSSSSSSSSNSSCSGASSLSSSFSVNSNALFDLHFLKKSSGDSSKIETSVEDAIAHCKNCQ